MEVQSIKKGKGKMNRWVKGAVMVATATSVVMGMSVKDIAYAQAPSVGTDVMERIKKEQLTVKLLPNPVLKNKEKECCVETFAVRSGTESSLEYIKQLEEKKKEEARKKRLKKIRAQKEEKRKQEIMACCGVAAGSDDRRILERIVEAEATGEGYKGKLLVANVVLNRVKSKKFPSTVKGVVFAHRQFSPVWDGRYYSVTVTKETKAAVDAALNGKDPSKGALYFMERSAANPSNVTWFDRALTKLFRYGCHEFFK